MRPERYARLYSYETLLERLAQDLEDMAAELGPCIQEEHAVVGQRHLARHRHVAPTDQPHIRARVVGGRNGRVVTNAVRAPVRPATRWMRVVSMASARVIAGRMVVSRRASLDFPTPGGPRRRRFGTQRRHPVPLHYAEYEGLRGRNLVTWTPGQPLAIEGTIPLGNSAPISLYKDKHNFTFKLLM
jgi:hypothetical protein